MTEELSDKATDAGPEIDRWTMMRDIAVFQVKLVVDGLRDFLLVPASLIVGIVSLFGDDGKPSSHFYDLLKLGKRSERFINLFGALKHSPGPIEDAEQEDDASIDDLVQRIETFVVDEYRRGGVTSQAKQRVDEALNAIQRNMRPKDPG